MDKIPATLGTTVKELFKKTGKDGKKCIKGGSVLDYKLGKYWDGTEENLCQHQKSLQKNEEKQWDVLENMEGNMLNGSVLVYILVHIQYCDDTE